MLWLLFHFKLSLKYYIIMIMQLEIELSKHDHVSLSTC